MQEISGLRHARSLLTPEGTEVLTTELDFQLGPRMGIAIYSVLGHLTGFINTSLGSLADEINSRNIFQTLHLETGTVEDPLDSAAQDAYDIDTEIFYRQDFTQQFYHDTTAGEGKALSTSVTPNGLVTFPEPILTARNITHRAEALVADVDGICGVLIAYKYVEFSLSEMGLLLARRS